MTPTTARALRSQFRSAIEGITPTYAEFQDHKWVYAESPEDVPGPAIRTFALLSDVAEAEPPDIAVMGGGISYAFTLQVMVTYGALPLTDDEQIIEEDARDLWLALDDVKASNTGLIDVSYPAWGNEAAVSDGNVHGFFEFEIRYYGRNS